MHQGGRLLAVLIGLAAVLSSCGGAAGEVSSTSAPSTTVPVAATSASTTTTVAAPVTTAAPTTSTTIAPTTTTTMDPTKPTIAIGDGHLAYECRGEGSPTVLIEIGLSSDDSMDRDPEWLGWVGAIDLIAETNKVCIYGRRGVLGSEFPASSSIRSTNDQVDDLEALIGGIDLETPLVLVGHSIGGWNLRVFADRHPEQVTGVVMVEAADPDEDSQTGMDAWPDPFAPEWFEFRMSAWQVESAGDLGDLPMYVMTATEGAPDWWLDYQKASLMLSTVSTQTLIGSTHADIFKDAPDEIAKGVAWVIANAG
jgi:pimeloyl-ACP methyl ester carboxylesterase